MVIMRPREKGKTGEKKERKQKAQGLKITKS